MESSNEPRDVRFIVTSRLQPNLLLYILAVAAILLLAPYVGVHIVTSRPALLKEEGQAAQLRRASDDENNRSSQDTDRSEPSAPARGEGLAEIEQLLGPN